LSAARSRVVSGGAGETGVGASGESVTSAFYRSAVP